MRWLWIALPVPDLAWTVTAGEPMLLAEPFENALGRAPLLAVPAQIILQPLVNDLGEATRFRPLDRRRPTIPGRH